MLWGPAGNTQGHAATGDSEAQGLRVTQTAPVFKVLLSRVFIVHRAKGGHPGTILSRRRFTHWQPGPEAVPGTGPGARAGGAAPGLGARAGGNLKLSEVQS
jgi:hypothetical protein